MTFYLFSQSRVVGQNPGERNFHIFYQIIKGAPQEYKGIYYTLYVYNCNFIRLILVVYLIFL